MDSLLTQICLKTILIIEIINIIIQNVKCDCEIISPIISTFVKSNNTIQEKFKYCDEEICTQLKSSDPDYYNNETTFNTCQEEHYSCTQVSQGKDYEIQFEMCQEYCYKNMTSQYNSTSFNQYKVCQSSCLNYVVNKRIFETSQQETNYPFYKYYSKCMETNCTNIIVESRNSQSFNYYQTIFMVCQDTQILCKQAKYNYNVTQIKSNCYDLCINNFKDTDQDAYADPDFKNLLTCDSSCLNQTVDYQTNYFKEIEDELKGQTEIQDTDYNNEIKSIFWITLGVGLSFITIISCIQMHFIRVHNKTLMFKYEAKYTDSDEDYDENEEEEEEQYEDDDEAYRENQNNEGEYDQEQFEKRGNNERFQRQNTAGVGNNFNRKLKSSDQEGVGRRQPIKSKTKLTDGINIELRDSKQTTYVENDKKQSPPKKMQFKEDIENIYEDENNRNEDRGYDQSAQYDFSKDKHKHTNSMNMNSHKNLKEQLRINNNRGEIVSPPQSVRRQRKNLEDNSPSPPGITSIIKQESKTSKNISNGIEMQQYGTTSKNISPEKKQKQNSSSPQKQNNNSNNINLDNIFNQIKNNCTFKGQQRDTIRGEDDEKNIKKGNYDITSLKSDKYNQQETINNLKRQNQQSAYSPYRNTIIQSNQIFSEINFGFDQSPSSNTHQAMIQKQLSGLSQVDQQQFSQILNQIKKGQNFSDKTGSHPEFMPHDDITSPDTHQNQFLYKGNINTTSESTQNINQYQQRSSNVSKISQIQSSNTVDESRFLSVNTQNQTQNQMRSEQNKQDNALLFKQIEQQQNKTQNIKEEPSQQQPVGQRINFKTKNRRSSKEQYLSTQDQINNYKDQQKTLQSQQTQQNLTTQSKIPSKIMEKAGEILNTSQQFVTENSYLRMESSPKIMKIDADDDQDKYQYDQNNQQQSKIKKLQYVIGDDFKSTIENQNMRNQEKESQSARKMQPQIFQNSENSKIKSQQQQSQKKQQ